MNESQAGSPLSVAEYIQTRFVSFPLNPWVVVALVGFTIFKFGLAGILGSTADVPQMLSAARALLGGQDLLDPANTGGNPTYLLFGHSLIAAICLLVSEFTGISFDMSIKVPAILSDLCIALLLRTMPRGGHRAALIYMFNPVTFLLSVYHGQLHTVALAGAIIAFWLADHERFQYAGIMLALSATIRQHFGVLIVPLVMVSGRRWYAILVAFGLILFFVNAPLLGSTHIDRLLMPLSNYGLWGYAMLFRHGPAILSLAGLEEVGAVLNPVNRALESFTPWFYWLWAVAFVVWAWRCRVKDSWLAALLFLLGIYAVGPGFGVQRLIWVIPFWLIVNPREAVVYSALAGAFIAGSYWQWSLNSKYGVGSITANLDLLSWNDLSGICLVGSVGFITWAYCTRTAWRLANRLNP